MNWSKNPNIRREDAPRICICQEIKDFRKSVSGTRGRDQVYISFYVTLAYVILFEVSMLIMRVIDMKDEEKKENDNGLD